MVDVVGAAVLQNGSTSWMLGRPRTAMADVVGAAAEGEHKLDVGEIVPVINTEETKGRKSVSFDKINCMCLYDVRTV